MKVAFGLDLAGYTTNKTCLSVVEAQGRTATATLLLGTVFSLPHSSVSPLRPILKEEVKVINECAERGSVAVDVPIDLQGLLDPKLPEEIWGLTSRPIDRKLHALRPLSDRLGSAVARFKAIMATEGFKAVLGRTLFETYPAACLRSLECNTKHYKQDTKAGQESRIEICKSLRLEGVVDLNDDEIASIVCALTVFDPTNEPPIPPAQMPLGYILPKRCSRPFDKVVVKRKEFPVWVRNSSRK